MFDVIETEASRLGECPLWCERTQCLWWVDVLTPSLFSYDTIAGKSRKHEVKARRIGSLALRENGGLVLACDNGLFRYDPVSGEQHFLIDPEPHRDGHRKNDGRTDWMGNFWIGTLRERDYAPVGALYKVASDLSVACVETNLAIPNGLAFDRERRRMYFADTRAYTLWVRNYDPENGHLGEKRVFATTTPPARPDGSCLDSEGYLWNALYAGGKLIRFTPAGEIDRIIELPVSHPTCCCFGGRNMDTLFITSAYEPLTAEQRQQEPFAGKTLTFQPGVRGNIEFRTQL